MASTSTGVTSEASTSTEQQYQCQFCDAVFEDKLILSKHYKTCHRHNDTFLCTKCDFTTEYLGDLKQHASLHLYDMYYCVICTTQFYTFRELTDHENVHKCMMSNMFACNICANAFPSFNDLRIHHKISHFFRLFYNCGICDNHFSTFQEFQNHQNVHKCMTSNMFVCTICRNQNFHLFSGLLNHHIQVHLDKFLYICVMCDGVCKNKRFLSIHYNNCHKHNGKCVCAKCDYTAKKFFSVRQHAEMHSYDKSSCVICDKHFYTKHEYNTHRDSHKCTTSNKYRCGICKPTKDFKTFFTLTEHHERKHLNKSCDISNTTYEEKKKLDECRYVSLKRPYNSEDQQEKCDKLVSSIDSRPPNKKMNMEIYNHRSGHSGWPFPCEICNKQYDFFVSHVLPVHPNVALQNDCPPCNAYCDFLNQNS